MSRIFSSVCALGALFFSAGVVAQGDAEADYVRIDMSIDVDAPAAEVWDKVGGFCDIAVWFPQLSCEIAAGDGGVGTVRVLAGGFVTEVLVGKTDLSYGYMIPAVQGEFYDSYHGFLEAKPVTATTSRLIYTLFYDASNLDAAAKEADITRRRNTFEGALQAMKDIAEAD